MYWQCQRVSQMTQQQLDNTLSQLSPSRKEHILRFRREEDRARSLTGEWLLRELLNQHWQLTQPQILREESGRPVLEGGQLYITIAHSEDMVVCAADEAPVGIDVEQLKPFRWALANKICTPQEMEYLLMGQTPSEDLCQDEETMCRFYEIWTGKEGWFKMLGTGLQDLKSVSVTELNRQVYRQDEYLIQIVTR